MSHATAVVYLRVSTDRQAKRGGSEEGFSIRAQREACLRKAADLKAIVVEEFIDAGESARSANRPELQRMLARVRSGDIDYVIVHKLDRLARSRRDDVEIGVSIRKTGATLISVTENIDETPAGTLLHGIMASFSEYYSRNLAAEALKGMEQKVKAGGTPTGAPIGYLNQTGRFEGREVRYVEVDEQRAPLVKWGFDAFATGDYSISSLTRELQDRGLSFRATPKKPERPISRSAVHRMLGHPYYIGKVRWRGAIYDGNHQPLVSEETWMKVQDQLVANRDGRKREQHHRHYLRGLLACALCGERIGLTYSTGKSGRVYGYFYCIGRQKRRSDCELPPSADRTGGAADCRSLPRARGAHSPSA